VKTDIDRNSASERVNNIIIM